MVADVSNGGGGRGFPWRLLGWGTVVVLLLLPLVAGAPWTASDYVFAAVLMGSVGAGMEFAVRKANSVFTVAAGLALAAGFLLIWINGAVGIIGDEGGPNVFYLVAVAIALFGSAISLFRPTGMAWAMIGAAAATIAVPIGAAIFGLATRDELLAFEVPAATLFFTGMWMVSAALFRKAAE